MTDTKETQAVVLTHILDHPPEKVWRALTEQDLLAKWIMANDLQPRVGYICTFTQPPTQWWDGIVHCEVLEVQRHRRLRYSWCTRGADAMRLDTVVTWTLTPTPSGGTQLLLEHTGFAPSNRFAFDGAGLGWKRNVTERLTAVLSTLD